MELAKPVLDVGLYTTDRDGMLRFWQHEVGLPFEETLPAGRGVHQHRHGCHGSVVKINHSRDPLPDQPPSGYRELWIAREDLEAERRLVDPDGNRVRLVPPGTRGIEKIAVLLAVRDAGRFDAWCGDVLRLERVATDAWRWGETLLFREEDRSLPEDMPERHNAKMRAPGYRYLTVQVWDVDAVHRDLLSRGASEGHGPLTLGRVARISFVRDPDGNWIEISQRASLTGPLDPTPGSAAPW